jgi:DNA-binding transcriptional ArsR family regulator
VTHSSLRFASNARAGFTSPARKHDAALTTRGQIIDQVLTCKYFIAYYRQGSTCIFCMAERKDTDVVFKALADNNRRKLLDLLHAHDGRTLNELCEHLDMTRQGVTQHLDLLQAANLVATVRRGRERLHFLNPVPLQEIYERWIAKFEKPRLKALSDLKKRLEKTNA